MTRHWVALVVCLLLMELGVFAYWNQDLVFLSRGADALAADAAFPGAASAALSRSRVSRRVLERIADAAGRRGAYSLQAAALKRIVQGAPGDRVVELRLAEALRADGQLAAAELLYNTVLGRAVRGDRP